jgi:hypothetical protein
MTLYRWIEMLSVALIFAFIIFAFRQGSKVKPNRDHRGDNPGYNDSGYSGYSGDSGDGGGH